MSKLQIISKEIISILRTEINGSEVNSVNSREIYKELEVKDKYPTCFNRAVEKYDFLEGDDRFRNVVMEIEFFEDKPKHNKRISIYDNL